MKLSVDLFRIGPAQAFHRMHSVVTFHFYFGMVCNDMNLMSALCQVLRHLMECQPGLQAKVNGPVP
jgi:hypothetical protein